MEINPIPSDSSPSSIVVLVNKNSGSFFSLTKLAKVVSRHQQETNLRPQYIFTNSRSEAIESAYQSAKIGTSKIMIWGGDGSLNAALNGVMRAKRQGINAPILVILGGGSGSDFRRSLRLQKNTTRFSVDVGILHCKDSDEPRFFINGFSFGVTAEIAALKERMPRWFPGNMKYLVSTFIRLIQGDLYKTVQIDDKNYKSILGGLYLNGQFVGGGMRILSDTHVNDGVFEQVILRRMNVSGILSVIASVYAAGIRHKKDVQIDTIRDGSIISLPAGSYCEADGEIFDASALKISIDRQAIQIEVLV